LQQWSVIFRSRKFSASSAATAAAATDALFSVHSVNNGRPLLPAAGVKIVLKAAKQRFIIFVVVLIIVIKTIIIATHTFWFFA